LSESGPVEVARAARAFNAMQRELKAYLETRSHALAAVSHDLRLPLTRARLRLEHIEDARIKSSLESDLEEMERMIGGTLEYLRAGASSERAIRLNLDALLESVAEDMEALGARVRIEGRADGALTARAQALRRCLANLMDNARRHGGGDVDVTLLDAPDRVRIRIQDRGPGIAAAERQRVFEPYVRLEPSRARHTGGSGLGLAIARAIARAHGGDIVLSERAGGGLCAELWLPRAAATGEPVPAS
jgi:signal transduction histidine kinase